MCATERLAGVWYRSCLFIEMQVFFLLYPSPPPIHPSIPHVFMFHLFSLCLCLWMHYHAKEKDIIPAISKNICWGIIWCQRNNLIRRLRERETGWFSSFSCVPSFISFPSQRLHLMHYLFSHSFLTSSFQNASNDSRKYWLYWNCK